METVEVPCPKSGVRYELYAADYDVAQQFWSEASAEFCAAARNLLPEVLAELERREGVSGIAEKAAR